VVAIYFVAAAVALYMLYNTLHYSVLELTDDICCWSVFGHHTVIAVNIILSKSKLYQLHPQIICSVTIVVARDVVLGTCTCTCRSGTCRHVASRPTVFSFG